MDSCWGIRKHFAEGDGQDTRTVPTRAVQVAAIVTGKSRLSFGIVGAKLRKPIPAKFILISLNRNKKFQDYFGFSIVNDGYSANHQQMNS